MGLNPKQEAIVNTLDASVNVAAGAGTGKTFTLTKRTVAAIEWILDHPNGLCCRIDNSNKDAEGAKGAASAAASVNPIERVLEITFTEKAASELKSRVRSELFAVAMETGSEQMMSAALDADNAWISTIHAMCSRILKENALAFGIDPAFKLLTNAESQALLGEAVLDALDEFKQTSQFADDLLDAFTLEPRGKVGTSIVSMIRSLLDKTVYMPKGLDGVVSMEFSYSPGGLLRELLEASYDLPDGFVADGLNKSEAAKSADYADQLFVAQDNTMQWLEGYTDVHSFGDAGFDAAEYMAVMQAFPATSNKYGLKSEAADAFNQYRYTYKQVYMAATAQIGLRYTHALLDFAKCVQKRVDLVKSSGATSMDNNDLLRRCATELAKPENSDIAKRYREQFAFIMLDEFQDTDKLQMQIVKTLAHTSNSIQGDIDYANLCTVGDMQQSIYRFRGGDVEESLTRKASLAGINDAIFDLDANYRSHPAVLNTVETIF
jgi:ATP-dependent exoDNAse (exonuclease V) beta subunit